MVPGLRIAVRMPFVFTAEFNAALFYFGYLSYGSRWIRRHNIAASFRKEAENCPSDGEHY